MKTKMAILNLLFAIQRIGLAQIPTDFVRTSGNKIVVGADNREIILRGVNLINNRVRMPNGKLVFNDDNDEGTPFLTKYSEADYQSIADLGFNVIRLTMNYRIFEDNANPFVYKASGWAWLDQQIQWAKNNNLYLSLDLHVPKGGFQPTGGDGAALWDTPVYQDRLKALWFAIADRYKNEPTIASYDLLNEPVPTASVTQ